MTARQLLAAARKAGIDVHLDPVTGQLLATVGPETPFPLPAALMIEVVDRSAEIRPLLDPAVLEGAA
jgi:hypothetical protein